MANSPVGSVASIVGGKLVPLEKCWLYIPSPGNGITIFLDNIPDISDSKSTQFSDEPVIGRASPLKTYSYSDTRALSINFKLYSQTKTDILKNIQIFRAIESLAYPRKESQGMPYQPPPVCKFVCGEFLGSEPLCVQLKSVSKRTTSDVPWDLEYYIPWKVELETTWDVVYSNNSLPGQERIFDYGR